MMLVQQLGLIMKSLRELMRDDIGFPLILQLSLAIISWNV